MSKLYFIGWLIRQLEDKRAKASGTELKLIKWDLAGLYAEYERLKKIEG